MIPKTKVITLKNWSSTAFGPSLRLAHMQGWFYSWFLIRCSVRVSSNVDSGEVLSNTRQGDFHIFVADVVKSFDFVDHDYLKCALRRLGVPAWFREVYVSCHKDVRLRF